MIPEEDIWEYVRAMESELRAEIASLRAEVKQLRQPEVSEGKRLAAESVRAVALETGAGTAEFWKLVASLKKEAPGALRGELEATLLALDRAKEGRELAQFVVELVELCEESRRSADLSDAFYDDLDERLARLTAALELETIYPQAGQPYRAQEHFILRSVRGGGGRDTVERCLKRGFRWQGQLLKKAEVSVFI